MLATVEKAPALLEYPIETIDSMPASDPLPWVDADTVPALHAARVNGLQQVTQLLAERQHLLNEHRFDEVPYVVDPLSTAARANEARRRYGEKSPEYEAAYEVLFVNSQRHLGEAWSQNAAEYFPELPQVYHPGEDAYFFHNESITKIVGDGVTPVTEAEELGYRLTEAGLEEPTYVAIRKMARLSMGNVVFLQPGTPVAPLESQVAVSPQRPEMRVLTVTQCSDDAIAAYERGSHDWHGYAPQIKKLKIRGIRFSTTEDVRFQEEMAVSGEHITNDIINQAMQLIRIAEPGEYLTKAEVRQKQIINFNGIDAIGFLKLLDELASQASGKRIFKGEEIPDNQPKDYDAIPAEAAARQEKMNEDATTLSDYLLGLEASKVDHWAAIRPVQDFMDTLLFEKVRDDPNQAAIVFDQKTADGLMKVMQLKETGRYKDAALLEEAVRQAAPPSGGCGAGSCDGIEAVNPHSLQAARAREMGLKGWLSHDYKRNCPKCRQTTVYYDVQGNKACINTTCAYRQIGGMISKGTVVSEKTAA